MSGSSRKQDNKREEKLDDRWEEYYLSFTTLTTRHYKDDKPLISLVFSKEYKDASKGHTREIKSQYFFLHFFFAFLF